MSRDNYNIASVEKVFQLMDLLSKKNGQYTVKILAQILDVSPSNITRLLQTMCDAGYVEKSQKTKRYYLNNKIYQTANNMLDSNECIQKYTPVAYKLAEHFNTTVTINSLLEKNAITLTRISGHYERVTQFKIGNLVPAYCTSCGKAMLSQFTELELERYLDNLEFERYQINTISDVFQLRQELELAKRNGYAVNHEERSIGLVSISIALTEFDQPYALTIVARSSRGQELFSDEAIKYMRKCINWKSQEQCRT